MQYILMLYVNEAGWPKLTPAEQEQGMAAYNAYTEALTKASALKGSGRLQPSANATTVRVANGKPPNRSSSIQPETFDMHIAARFNCSAGPAIGCQRIIQRIVTNCFIELGYGLGTQNRVLVTAEEGTKLPFDQEMIPCHFWKPSGSAADRKKALVEFWEKNVNRPPIVKVN